MEVPLLTELENIHDLIHAEDLADDVGKTVNWCLDGLPRLYSDFGRTYEIRYGDEIRRLVGGLLAKLSSDPLKQAIVDQLLTMHERLGIPPLNFVPRPRKAAR
jgi:hypothetical protein